MDKIIDVLNAEMTYSRLAKSYVLSTSPAVMDVIAETGFLINPCEETLQAVLRLIRKYGSYDYPTDLQDYYRTTPLLVLMGYYDRLHPGFIVRCVRLLFDTEDNWSPRPFVLGAQNALDFLDLLWFKESFREEFDKFLEYSKTWDDPMQLKCIKAFQFREKRMKRKFIKF